MSSRCSRAGLVGAVEAIEEQVATLFRDAFPGVAHYQSHRLPAGLQLDIDLAVGAIVVDRIADQIGHHSRQVGRIP